MENPIMINVKYIRELINYKKTCKLWLDPKTLNAKQIRDTIGSFAGIIGCALDSKKDKDRLAGFIESLIEDVDGMDSISEEEKNEAIFEYIDNHKKQLSLLAQRAIKQINIQLKNYENEVYNKWLEGEYNPEALALFTNDVMD